MNKKKKQRDKHCYLISTFDEYELPVYIGDKMKKSLFEIIEMYIVIQKKSGCYSI